MKFNIRLSLVPLLLLIASCNTKKGEYVCQPCDQECDLLTFTESGSCPHCKMDLIAKTEIPSFDDLITKNIALNTGSGSFTIEDTKKVERRAIEIFYHKPKDFTPESKVLIVVPGAGRNGDSYRDAWIEESEKHGVLVISPKYPENYFAFEDYHLCGLIRNPNMGESVTYVDNSNHVILDEDQFNFEINSDAKTWLFNDFDRIFELVLEATNSNQTTYDIFGHSAGGQILHRFVLFYPENKANNIIAANSGFYTMPDTSITFPFGIKHTHLNEENLKTSFKNKLIVYLGAQDDENETGGTLLRSATVDKQGLGRLSRGKHFYEFAEELSKKMNTQFNWSINIVPNSGHDHRKMGDAVARFLYENQSATK